MAITPARSSTRDAIFLSVAVSIPAPLAVSDALAPSAMATQSSSTVVCRYMFYFASICRSTLRTSRCFSSESGSFTCCTITMSFCEIVRIVPSNSLSPARTM